MMNQNEINRAEWENHDNWAHPRWLGIYFSKRDSRSWVPKPSPILGWTVNLGKKEGAVWALGIILSSILGAFFAGWII